ncbi:MAG TPA: ABC transporter substrate-binding protein [Candidatus Binataceae bacterium]|nr:ABC transporter substrate-binding protein [Candidatus Binataceae bacterium]
MSTKRNPSRIRATILAMLLTAVALASASPARADDPMPLVQTMVNQALAVLRDKQTPLAQRQDQLRKIVSAQFDFREMAKSALGRHWREITPAQQDEFTTAFIAFIEDSYLSQIDDYHGEDVKFIKTKADDPGYAQVNTLITQQDKDPIKVNYRLEQENGVWKIYDVTVDAISIIANYRNQFNRVMNNQGYDTLIADLKSKQESLAKSLANH